MRCHIEAISFIETQTTQTLLIVWMDKILNNFCLEFKQNQDKNQQNQKLKPRERAFTGMLEIPY